MILNSESFELRILKKKRRLGIEEFKKGIKRKLFFIVPAQEAKSGQPLAPILGQVQINTFEFATAFNNKSKEFQKGTLIFVELIVMWDKTYTLNLKPFPFQFFVHEYIFSPIQNLNYKNSTMRLIYIVDVYKLCLLYQKLTAVPSVRQCFKTVLGCLNSFNIHITSFSEQDYLNNIQFFMSNYWDIYMLIEKNIKGFGIYNHHLHSMLELLEFDLLFLEDREETETLSKEFLDQVQSLDEENIELLEY